MIRFGGLIVSGWMYYILVGSTLKDWFVISGIVISGSLAFQDLSFQDWYGLWMIGPQKKCSLVRNRWPLQLLQKFIRINIPFHRWAPIFVAFPSAKHRIAIWAQHCATAPEVNQLMIVWFTGWWSYFQDSKWKKNHLKKMHQLTDIILRKKKVFKSGRFLQ